MIWKFLKLANRLFILSLLVFGVAACGSGSGGGDGNGDGGTMYTIGGAISGLSGTVVLQNNGGDDLSRSANGAFTFATGLPDGAAYNVTVATQPVGQGCTVTQGSGTVSGNNVTTVAVNCSDGSGAAARFKTLSYIDEQGIGLEAFRMLIPSDWSFDGAIEWRFDNPGAPAVASFRVRAPDGTTELQLLPAQPFFSTQDPLVLGTFPIGSKYFGNEVRSYPALGSLPTLKEIILPRFRGNVTNLQMISEQALPEIAGLLRAGIPTQPNSTIEAAKVRIEYELNGRAMEEEIYCIVETASFTTFPNYNNTIWVSDFLFSFKAEKGSLDSQYQLFQTMMYSFRVNPQWFNKYVQLIDYLVQQQIKIIQSYGQLSQIISQTSDEISDMVMQSYNNRNAASDRMAEDFADYIRGTDTYYNPTEDATVKLPSGYGDAWANALGEYILSNDANYDPNIGSGQNWQRLEIR